MKNLSLSLFFCFLMFLVANQSLGQTKVTDNVFKLDQGAKPGPGKINDAKWLTGHWKGEGLGGVVDEVWSKPRSGHMSGLFRFFEKDKLEFSEYFTISEEGPSLNLSLLHFDAKLVGWEEKGKPIVYRLVKTDRNSLYFDGLTYRLEQDGTLRAFVLAKQKNGSLKELSFSFKKGE